MSAWVLILTISTWHGVAVTTATFETEAACRSAASAWKEINYARTWDKVAQCFPTKK